jgi:hypothetical protein
VRYQVTAPYVVLKVPDPMSGSSTMRGFYRGMIVPDGIDADNLKHHIDGDMVAELAELVAPRAEPVVEPVVPVVEPVKVEDEPAKVPAKTTPAKAK